LEAAAIEAEAARVVVLAALDRVNDVMPSKPMKIQYVRRSPFLLILLLTKDELNAIDGFVDLAKEARKSQQEKLERLAAPTRRAAPHDDWLVDDFAQLGEFAALSAEFAIIGLWRCVELYRQRAIRTARYNRLQKELQLLKIAIRKQRIRCARSVDELRCLNNAIKHNRRVAGELADLPRWRGKRGCKLSNLEGHYARLRFAAERYLSDLVRRLSRRTGHLRSQGR
jgi:hypothetical protein